MISMKMKKLISNITVKGLFALLLTSSLIYSAEHRDILTPEERALETIEQGSARIVINYYDSAAIKQKISEKKSKAVKEYILSEYLFLMAHRKISNRVFFMDGAEYRCDIFSDKLRWTYNKSDEDNKKKIVIASYFEGRTIEVGHPYNSDDLDFEYFIASHTDRDNRIILNVPDNCEDILGYEIEKALKRDYGERLVEIVGKKKTKKASFLSLRNFSVSLCMIIVAYMVYKRL